MQYNQYQQSLAVRREWLQNVQDNFLKVKFYVFAFKYVVVPFVIVLSILIAL